MELPVPPHITSCGAQCQNQTPRVEELCCVRAATARFPPAVILPQGTAWGLGAQANRYTQIFLLKRQAALAQSSNQKSCWCDGAAIRAAQPDCAAGF